MFLEGSNLLGETQYAYNTYRDVPAQYQQSGRFYFVGMRTRLPSPKRARAQLHICRRHRGFAQRGHDYVIPPPEWDPKARE